MNADREAPAARRLFFGWKVVGAAFVVAVFAWGVGFYGPSVYLKELHETRGWSVTLISAAITSYFLLSALIVAYLRDLHRQFGIARVTAAGAVALAVGVIGWAHAAAPWQLFVVSIVFGFGWATTSGAAINAMVAPWFDQKRAMALSLAFNGASFGGVLFTPAWAALIDKFGFERAALLIGATLVGALWLLAARYLAATPQSVGLGPDGRPPEERIRTLGKTDISPLSRRELFRKRQFATLSGAFALGLFAQVGLIAHMVSLLASPLGNGGAAAAVSLATACAVAGRVALGAFLGDRDRRAAAAANFLLQAGGTVLLAVGPSPAILLTGCVLFGLGIGNLISLPPLIAQKEFAGGDVPRVVALVTAVNQAVFSFAPAAFGALRDATGGYAIPVLVAAVMQAAAALAVLVGRQSR